MSALPPGSTIGILGGGQLARMLAIPAAQLGYKCKIYAPEEESVAEQVSNGFTCSPYEDAGALLSFAQSCDVVTYEFENVPVSPLEYIKNETLLRPGTEILKIAQSRFDEKNYVKNLGGQTAPFAMVKTHGELTKAIGDVRLPAILKTNRFGYDGKGQIRLDPGSDLSTAWFDLGKQEIIAEAQVNFDAEFSVILVRGSDGEIRYWQSTRNVHKNGILATASLPAGPLIESQESDARKISARIADALNYVGVLTCEFFATAGGPIFNEMAPRVHNSGHWSIEGSITSQFENHIRAICGLPLGDTRLTAERIEMENIIGDDGAKSADKLKHEDSHLHFYGKSEARTGRKMGHITRLYR